MKGFIQCCCPQITLSLYRNGNSISTISVLSNLDRNQKIELT